MAIQWSCPNCGGALRVADEYAGRTVGCPRCKTAVVCPTAPPPDALPDEEEALGAPIPRAPQHAWKPPRRKRQGTPPQLPRP